MGFSIGSSILNIEIIQKVLNIQQIVFCDLQLTKMHDILQLTFFPLNNF